MLSLLKNLIKKYLSACEIAADELATQNFTHKQTLASAMAKILDMEEKNYLKKELAVSYFSQMTEERIMVLADNSYKPSVKKEILLVTASLVGGVVLALFLGTNIQKQQARAQEAYTASGCANKLVVEQCENLWSKCKGQPYHEQKSSCPKVDKTYLQN